MGLNYGIANNTGRPDEQASFKILKSAVENGINSFDTASTYGVAEEVLGQFFINSVNTIANPVITTKISKFDFETDQTLKDTILKQVDDSLRKLKLAKIPILMIHFFSDYIKRSRIIIDCLKELKACGKADKIGISLYTYG
jgi:aryl-alcohol dehydrogenase-like predicted oxidoreductase